MKPNQIAFSIAALLLTGYAAAEPLKKPRGGKIPYSTVSEALTNLKKQEGVLISGDEARGFVVTEADQKTQWLFTPANQAAYPSVVRRVIRSSSEEPSEVSILCEKQTAACNQLLTRYKILDEMSGSPVMGVALKASSAR